MHVDVGWLVATHLPLFHSSSLSQVVVHIQTTAAASHPPTYGMSHLVLWPLQVSQMVIAYADYKIRQQDPRFPVGQARLEAIGVLACEA